MRKMAQTAPSLLMTKLFAVILLSAIFVVAGSNSIYATSHFSMSGNSVLEKGDTDSLVLSITNADSGYMTIGGDIVNSNPSCISIVHLLPAIDGMSINQANGMVSFLDPEFSNSTYVGPFLTINIEVIDSGCESTISFGGVNSSMIGMNDFFDINFIESPIDISRTIVVKSEPVTSNETNEPSTPAATTDPSDDTPADPEDKKIDSVDLVVKDKIPAKKVTIEEATSKDGTLDLDKYSTVISAMQHEEGTNLDPNITEVSKIVNTAVAIINASAISIIGISLVVWITKDKFKTYRRRRNPYKRSYR